MKQFEASAAQPLFLELFNQVFLSTNIVFSFYFYLYYLLKSTIIVSSLYLGVGWLSVLRRVIAAYDAEITYSSVKIQPGEQSLYTLTSRIAP